jgi:hypothetical protein
MVEVKGFRFKLRVVGSLLSPTIMSGINTGDEVSNLFLGRRACYWVLKI